MTSIYRLFLKRLDDFCDQTGLNRGGVFFACFFLCLGTAVRTRNYLAGISFWNDEAALAGNLLEKSMTSLFGPLDGGQIAPIGFCLAEKVTLLFLGNNELSLRLIPFVAGLAALPLTFRFAHRAVGPFCAVLCLAQLAVIPEAVSQANNLKPYTLDLAIALGLMLLAWPGGASAYSRKRLLALGVCGMFAPWFSFSALFILFGIGVVVMMRCIRSQNWKGLALFSGILIAWAFSFWLQYHFLQTQSQDLYLLNFWNQYFMPFPPFGPGDWKFFSDVLPRVFKTPLWTLGARGSVVFFLSGCILIWKQSRLLLALILLPLILNLLVSGFHKYPFGERLLLYGVVNLYIPIAVFLEWLWHRKWRFVQFPYVALILIVLNLAKPTVLAVKCLAAPIRIEEMKPVAAYVADHYQPGDTLWVHNHAVHTFSYYGKRFGISPSSIRVSQALTPQTLNKIGEDLDALKGRVWLVFGHAKILGGTDYEKAFLNEAGKRGTLMDRSIHVGASAYLFYFPDLETKSTVQ